MTEKTITSKISPKKSKKKRSYRKKTTTEKLEKEILKTPEKIQDIIVNGIVRDLLIIIFIPLIYNIFRDNWSQIVILPLFSEIFLNQIGNLIVLGINFYENYIDLHKRRNIITALVDFIVNLILGIVFSDPTFIVVGLGYLVIIGVRFMCRNQNKTKKGKTNIQIK